MALPEKSSMSRRQRLLIGLVAWCVLVVCAACFWPALTGPFVFDDFPNLKNLSLLDGRVDRSSIGIYLFSFVGNPGRPLAALSFLIEDVNWPTIPEAFKRNNLFFHLLAGCLVFVIARAFARLRLVDEMRSNIAGLICCAMWLLHPLQLSATMLVVQRMTVLSGIFVLLGLIVYIRTLESEKLDGKVRVLAAGLCLAVFATLAILCKENGALIFAYASALNVTLLARRLSQLGLRERALIQWGAATPIILLTAYVIARPSEILEAYAFRDFTLSERLLSECRILIQYLASILMPRIGGQGVFHDDYVISRSLWDPISTAPSVLIILALAISAVRLRRSYPVYAFAVLWFFAGHLMESTIVALELYFEHRNYLPMIGPLYALSSWAVDAFKRNRAAVSSLVVVWLCTASLSTRVNAATWGDRGRLASVWHHEKPHSIRSIQMLASYYADEGDLVAARQTLSDGIAEIPTNTSLQVQRMLLDCINGRVNRSEWSRSLHAARRSSYERTFPELVSAFVRHANSGACNGTLTRGDAREFAYAVLANPNYQDNDTKGFLHYELSRLSLAEADLDGLMTQMDLSNYYRPNPLVSQEQAIYLLTAGLPEQSLTYLDKSENAKIPFFKKWIIDMPRRNANLRKSADRMLAQDQSLRDTSQVSKRAEPKP